MNAWPLLLLTLTGSKMHNQPTAPIPGPFGLEGDQYWNKPLQQKSAMAFGSSLVDKDVEGIFIDAPATIHLDKHGTVPLAAFRSGSTLKLRRFSLRTTTQLVLIHLETGRIQMAKAAETPPMDVNEPEPSPGWAMEDLEVNLAESMDLGPRLGRYEAFMVCGPESSNPRTITLFPSVETEAAKATLESLALLRKEGGPPQPLLVGKTVDLIHEPVKPAGGKEALWKLSHMLDGQGRHRIHLEYHLEGLPRFAYPKDRPHLDEKGKRIHANLPVLLAAFDENRSLVLVKNLGLPVMAEPVGEAGKPVFVGHVSLDLGTLVKPGPAAKALTLWVFSMNQRSMIEVDWAARKP